jgi:AraC-like DNA-binding protein
MKVLQFTIPVSHDKTIVSRMDLLPHFYPYLHRHKEMQLTWVQQGEGTLMVDHNMHSFTHNDIFIIGGGQPHLFKNHAAYFEEGSERIICSLDIFFDPEVICQTLLGVPELKHLRNFITLAQNGIQVPQHHTTEVARLMDTLYKTEDATQGVILFIQLLQLLAGISDQKILSRQGSKMINTETDGIRISHIYNYILQNYDKPITLEDVAGQAFMTPQAFCRFFKKHTRHTFVQFLNEVRIGEARKQFSTGSFESISSIAYNSGFNSITNFNRVFKSVMGQAPSEYIESLRELQQPGLVLD